MKYEEVDKFNNTKYTQKCDVCGTEVEVLTQPDDEPEYITDVYVKCQCGNYIKFDLPVN